MFEMRTRVLFAALAALTFIGCARQLPTAPVSGPANGANTPNAAAAVPGSMVPGQYVVTLRATPARDSRAPGLSIVRGFTARAGLVARHEFASALVGFTANLNDRQLRDLANDPSVASIEPDRYVRIEAQSVPTGITMVGAPAAQRRNVRGAGVKVGIIDTGMDYTHPDLAADYAGGIDLVNNDGDPRDDNGHGTHVAGTIAAVDNDLGVLGVAPAARLYAIKVLDANGSGTYGAIIAGLDWAAANHMQVVNLSLGGPVGMTALQQAVDNAYAAGVVICAAAGNSGGSVGYPAAYPNCICVSAVDNNRVIASFSSRGAEVDVAAPGVNVVSTWPGGAYATLNGTSMATPHVAGVAALVWAAGYYKQASTVRERLLATATDIGVRGTDPLYGRGFVNGDLASSQPANVLPVAKAGGPYSGVVSLPIAFSSAGSSDPDGRIVSWLWNFGDGTTSADPNPTHTFAAAKAWPVKLTVTDDRGGQSTVSVTATVGVDKLTIWTAEYVKSTKVLTVVASSTVAAAKLSVDGQGAMQFDSASQRWTLVKTLTSQPTSIRVSSTCGGTLSKAVLAK